MRCFIGLDLAPPAKLAVAKWREQALPPLSPQVPVQNFHITLAFLGQVSPSQTESLCLLLDQVDAGQFTLTLDQMGYFGRPKVLWLGCQHIPAALSSLATTVSRLARQAGIMVADRPYVPHVTLARKMASPPPPALYEPQVACRFNQFHLFESVSGQHGVRYPIRQSWELSPFSRHSINPGKKL